MRERAIDGQATELLSKAITAIRELQREGENNVTDPWRFYEVADDLRRLADLVSLGATPRLED